MAERFLIKNVEFPMDSVPIPESAQIARDHYNALAEQKTARVAKLLEEKANRMSNLRARTLKYRAEYAADWRKNGELKRQAVLKNGFYREPEAKVIFAVRIRGVRKLAPKPKKTLQLLRLRQINNGVFIRVNKASLHMLRLVEPFVAYGTLTLSRIRKLMYKRGYCKVGRMGGYNRIRITDNDMISSQLSKHGIDGMEDLIHEIHTCGPNFRDANAFLWPFKLNTPTGGFNDKRHGFNEARKGEWGNRQELMNQLVDRMI
eukprot:CAMPEP_0113860450 /NCGR_PEP_ID=MMETSP0372-20130328/13434_1 /TAXON_ID=340204 /ORGANISM="Lankesteria abbotti" /LENGTH=259 /DNA_ID=CAMNT_0000839835 /DNA_START=55 /DNA_END=834 /DNA_ORIENTATION=- /assembly_acc=CAM_ASM_000359